MSERGAGLPDHPECLNCGTELRGQYCGHCGQRARSRLISLWELLQDAFGDLFELDSRLWQTLVPLLVRPGRLTRDYLEGRRARYMPPFRMYLVLSVVFFMVAFFNPRDNLGLLFEPAPATPPGEQLADELHDAEPVIKHYGDEGTGLDFDYNNETGDCVVTGFNTLPAWMQQRLTRERLEGMCERIAADGGKNLGGLMLDNIPVALIVLLPLMAFVLKGLYPLSRRYFVEHLLFFVHFHAFFFLILTLQILFKRLGSLVRIPETVIVLVLVAASFYIPVYLYKAMRHVYGQGHVLTLAKYIVLSFAYIIGASFTMLGAMLFALLSV